MPGDDTGFRSREFSAQDGLRLFYREYGDAVSSATPLLCLPGLTRSSADFHGLAMRHAAERRVVALDYRGRGRSAYDPDPANYRPDIYISDVVQLLAAANLPTAIVIGTSLGGLLAMSLSAHRPTVLAGVVLNDIGPEVETAGLDKIKSYLAEDMRPATWEEAAAKVKEISFDAAPDFSEADWMALARRSFRESDNGGIRLDFDPALAASMQKDFLIPDLWPLFKGLRHVPTLAIRGNLSDVLATATFDRMAEANPDLIRISVPNRGHVPWLDEPECVDVLNTFIAGL